jgi:hypothetical protein
LPHGELQSSGELNSEKPGTVCRAFLFHTNDSFVELDRPVFNEMSRAMFSGVFMLSYTVSCRVP